MKAFVCTKYGPPEVLELHEVKKPVPKDNEVLIKIHATTCHIGDVRIRSFDVPFWQMIPFRLFLGITKPKRNILGMDFSGEIEEVGKNVKEFQSGEKVFGTPGFVFGTYAEYVCIPVDSNSAKKGLVAKMPAKMSFGEAAAGNATGGLTALNLINQAKIQSGQEVLIYGASGSVGTFAVQLAKQMEANVTAVCSTSNIELVISLGADKVIDYTKDDFTQNSTKYDVIIDAVGKLSYSKGKRSIKKNGIFLNVTKHSDDGAKIGTKELMYFKELIEDNKIKPVIDRTFPFEQLVEAHRYVEKGHKKGNVVITVI